MSQTQYQGALHGVRVLDLTRVLAGPFSTMMLADMGADIIKIEQPVTGDDSRTFYPHQNGESAYFMNLNRNKRGITLNLKKGKDLFIEMVKTADILVENYRPGTMEKLGLGYETLRKINPRLIYGAVSGFGHYGPYKDRAGYDIIGQAMGGLMSTTGWPDSPPTRSGTAISDVLGGLSVTIGILAALESRHRTGLGQKVDVALVDSVVASLEIINQIYITEGRIPTRQGNRYESSYPYDTFATKDGMCVIGAGNNKLWDQTCDVMGRPELKADPRFQGNPKRVAHHKELRVIIEEWSSTLTTDEVVDKLLAVGVPSCPIYNIKQVVEDPHIAGAREMFTEVVHPVAGKTKLTGCHIKLSDMKPSVRTPAPVLGQHNAEVLKDLFGFDENKVRELSEAGIL